MDKGRKRGKPTTRKNRGPLQDLNGHPICKTTSIPSSSAASVSIEAPKGCLRLLLSSSSSSSSSSRTLIDKNPKPYPKSTVIRGNKASAADASKSVIRSKENELSRKPNLLKSQRVQPLGVGQKPCGKITKPVCKNDRRSKVSSSLINPANKLKKVPQQLQVKAKTSLENCTESSTSLFRRRLLAQSNSAADNYTPLGKVAPLPNLDLRNVGVIKDTANEASNVSTASDVKTPPVEASQSPEIQRHSHSKIQVLKSAATPICYGAGHLVSGITDNRKCRRRGSLRGACERTNLFDVERSDEECAIVNLQESMVPLPAEASVRWVLSPCHEAHEDQVDIGDSPARLGQRRISCHYDLDAIDLLSSPSLLCSNTSDLLCDEGSYSGSGSVGNIVRKTRNVNVVEYIGKATEVEGGLGPLTAVDESMDLSPCGMYRSNCIGSGQGKAFSPNPVGDNSASSVGLLDSGNIIQTPSSDDCDEGLRSEVDCSNFIDAEIYSISETLSKVDLSPTDEILKWGASVLDSIVYPHNLTKLQQNVYSVSSWASDSMPENVTLSQMKISWKDGLVSRNVQTDDLDCCCLLDEEINADKSTSAAKPVENEENGSVSSDMDISPILSQYEPCILARGRKKSLDVPDICAESICTDGGGLVASGDSDWTYCLGNHFFQVK